MNFDMTKPCTNCPFRTDKTAIRFQCRERAEEIEEQAYRGGFPCHVTAESVEANDYGEDGGLYATEESQMCAGFIAMQLNMQEPPPSFRDNPQGLDEEELFERLEKQYGEFWKLPVFEHSEDFFEANENENEKDEKDKEERDDNEI